MNRNNMTRSRSTYSIYAYICLLVVIGILGYKHFELIKYSNQLKDQVYSFDSMVNQLKFEKNSIDKEKSTCSDTVKSMQSHMDDIKQNLIRKDIEIRDLFQYKTDSDQKLKQCDELKLEMDVLKSKLNTNQTTNSTKT